MWEAASIIALPVRSVITGSMRADFKTILEELDLLAHLAAYRPVVIGTPPLGIAVASSDIDIACCADDIDAFEEFADGRFGHLEEFARRNLVAHGEAAMLVSFRYGGWEIELFCQAVDVEQQWGVRHFRIEKRLLDMEPHLRGEVQALKEKGVKTEPAFATILQLAGDPYEAVLALENLSVDALQALLDGRVGPQ